MTRRKPPTGGAGACSGLYTNSKKCKGHLVLDELAPPIQT